MLHGKLAKDGYAHQLHGLFIAASLFLKQHLELRRDFFFLRWAPALSDRSAHMFRQFCILLRQGRTNPFTIRPESVSGYPLRPVWRPPLLLFQPLPKSSGRPAGFIDVSKPLLQINLANGTELICPRLMPRMVHCHHHSLQKRLIRIALINLPANLPFGVKNSPQVRIHRLSGSSLLSPAFLVQL